MTKNKTDMKMSNEEFTITRVFDAPRKQVWKAWTEPERFKKWWGPKDFTAPIINMDLHTGGKYFWCMHGPDSKDYWSTGEYREIVAPKKIVYTDSFADEKGNTVPASYYAMPGDWPKEPLVTVTFEEQDGKTKMILHHAGIPAGQMREMCEIGWNQSFDKLAESLQ